MCVTVRANVLSQGFPIPGLNITSSGGFGNIGGSDILICYARVVNRTGGSFG
ncbi:hypothetical protein EI94DRAFT_1725030 [Lactarius quietus]|nr:hypothetical protein EI94DRAFT_1725030 [Lactarius quietus]